MRGPIPSEADVLLAARSMLHQYGIDAAKEAVRRADDDLAKGEMLSSAGWMRIAAAIEKLQAEGATLDEIREHFDAHASKPVRRSI